MAGERLTKAQAKALEWLPSDGSWRTNSGRLSSALASLSLRPGGPRLCEYEYGRHGARGGWMSAYRLTIAGIAFKGRRI